MKRAIAFVCVLVSFATQAATLASMVVVGNPGNAPDTTNFGAVPYTYNISSTEVSNAEYAAFLNAVANTDTNGWYSTSMAGSSGGITQSGMSGSFMYQSVVEVERTIPL